jgi:pyruvate dehydrogenase E1 component alpha subunit
LNTHGRSPDFGTRVGAAASLALEQSLELFRRICRCRFFEYEAARACETGRISRPVYLSLGQEAVAAALSLVLPAAMIFTQHRCHAYYLAFGGPPAGLRDELLGRPGGCSGGRAGSNCLQFHTGAAAMFGHHGLIGENVPIAVGAALGSRRTTLCVFGDGAAEEDYIVPALGFAATHRLPVLFVCEDNDLSILTPTRVRRSWRLTDLARGLGLPAVELSDDPWSIADAARELAGHLPGLLNVQVCRERWHVGAGTDGPPAWDRFALVCRRLDAMGLKSQRCTLEEASRREMEGLWAA